MIQYMRIRGWFSTAIERKVMNMPKWVISRVIESSPSRQRPRQQPAYAITVPAAYPTRKILTLVHQAAFAKGIRPQYSREARCQHGQFIDLLA